MPARLRGRLAQQQGFTLIELITALGILSFVLTGIMVMFVSGIRAEVDVNERFQAQQEARLALATLRREVRSACWYDSATASATRVTLGYCGHSETNLNVVQSKFTWCVTPLAGQYGLFRQTGTTCSAATGVKKAERLRSNNVFAISTFGTDVRRRLVVHLDVDANAANSGGKYLLDDEIMFRNARSDVTAP